MGPERLLQQEEALSASREIISPKVSITTQDNETVGGQSESQCHPLWLITAGAQALPSVLEVIRNAVLFFHLHSAA